MIDTSESSAVLVSQLNLLKSLMRGLIQKMVRRISVGIVPSCIIKYVMRNNVIILSCMVCVQLLGVTI